MKTYLSSPSSSLLTASAIETTGENHLYSALNFGRVIAFTGSGSTMEYGRPSWSDLIDTFIKLAEANKNKILHPKHSEDKEDKASSLDNIATLGKIVNKEKLETIWEEFEKLFGQDKEATLEYRKIPTALRQSADFTASFLTLCEQIASWSSTNDDREKTSKRLQFRRDVAKEFAKTKIEKFYDATVQSIGHKQKFTPSDETALSKEKTAQKITFLEKNFAQHFLRETGDFSGSVRINSKATIAILCFTLAKALNLKTVDNIASLVDLDEPSQCTYDGLMKYLPPSNIIDPLTEIYQGLGINRYLTLNYDIEIERMLAAHLANKDDESHKEFCEFLNFPVNRSAPLQERELRNGLQQAIRTSSIGKDNLGDLFTFGAFSTAFRTSVFHLHGRVDDPKNMIITQLDYERLYLQSSNQRRSFEEARHAVFNGGDILFVGSGMKETDVMAPLKDFTASHRKLDDAPGRVYALILSSIDRDNWKAENTGQAQALFKHYGVYTLYLDGSDTKQHLSFRTARMWFSELTKALDSETISLPELASFNIDRLASENSPIEFSTREVKLIQAISEVALIDKAIQEVCSKLTKQLGPHAAPTKNIRKRIEVSILRRLVIESDKRLKSNILQQKLEMLCQKKTEWWRDWGKRPKHRLAIYGAPKKSHDKPLLWVRHRADYYYDHRTFIELSQYLAQDHLFNEPVTSFSPSTELYKSYFKQLRKEAANQDKKSSRIVRFTAPKGAGKGSLIKLLSEKLKSPIDGREYYPFELIFPNKENNYVGGFFAHLTFTLEFTSTIFALIRFLAKSAEIESDPFLNSEAINGFQQDRHTGIWLLKHALKEMAKTESRVFICLSGLFRLVDDDGDAYSPIHREFFRIITNTDLLNTESGTPKIDLLLLARTQAKPIRYLSIEKPISKKPTPSKSQKKFIHRRQVRIKKWPILEQPDSKLILDTALHVTKHSLKKLGFSVKNLTISNTIEHLLPAKNGVVKSHIKSLNTFINRSVVHIYLLVSLFCWRQIVIDANNNKQESSEIDLLINRLNIAVGRSGAIGFTKSVIKEYRELDLMMLQNNSPIHHIAPVNVTDVTLRHLALFNHPIQSSVLVECPDLALRLEQRIKKHKSECLEEIRSKKLALLDKTLEQLVAKRLVIRIHTREGEEDLQCRYSLHHEIAKVVTLDMNYITQYTLSSAPYQATFYCAQAQARRGVPSSDHFHFVTRLLKHFISIIDYSLKNTDINDLNKEPKLDFYECSAMLRGAYAILRGSFSIGAISRLEIMHELNNKQPYEAYRLWIQNIIHLSIRLSAYQDDLIENKVESSYIKKFRYQNKFKPRHFRAKHYDNSRYKYKSRLPLINLNKVKKYDTSRSQDQFMGEYLCKRPLTDEDVRLTYNLPFYRDEVAWLYNEQAVVSFMQGKLYDASVLYNQALHVVKAQPEYTENQSVGAPRRRIEINLAIAEIEKGEIHNAIDLLDGAINEITISDSSTTSMTLLYAKGYRALCDHLTGNLTKAKNGYKFVIKHVQKKRQLRATSIFQRHLADLYRIQGETEKASKLLLFSEKAASQAQQEDILHYTLISKARLMRDLKSRSEALQILRRTEDYAKTMGLRKMLAEALKVRAEVMLAEGEVTQAGKMSAQAVAIFNRNGLRLRKISAALLQAKVYQKRGQIKFAKKILAEIEREASSLGYTLKSSSAQEDRQNLIS